MKRGRKLGPVTRFRPLGVRTKLHKRRRASPVKPSFQLPPRQSSKTVGGPCVRVFRGVKMQTPRRSLPTRRCIGLGGPVRQVKAEPSRVSDSTGYATSVKFCRSEPPSLWGMWAGQLRGAYPETGYRGPPPAGAERKRRTAIRSRAKALKDERSGVGSIRQTTRTNQVLGANPCGISPKAASMRTGKNRDWRTIDIGFRTGKLQVVGRSKWSKSNFLVRCDCGKEYDDHPERINKQISCGCFRNSISRSPTYITWRSVITRCTRPTHNSAKKYLLRGIRVCDRWMSYDNFLKDMGERPLGTQIDRIDFYGNYEPGNCRWATVKEQANNKRNTIFLTHDGKTLPLSSWSELTGIPHESMYSRFRKGWNASRVITEKLKTRAHKACP